MTNVNREQLGEWLSAYLDGELEAKQTQQVERVLRDSAEARSMLAELRRVVSLVQSLPRHAASETVAEDVQLQIERAALIGESGAVTAPWVRTPSKWKPAFSLAAMIALVVCGVWLVSDVYRDGQDPRLFRQVDSGIVGESTVATRGTGGEELAVRADKPVHPPSDVLLASLHLEQKLSAGMGAEAVTQHNFENEPLRLQLVVNSQRELAEVESGVDRLLASRLEPWPEDSERQAKWATVPERFYYRGHAHLNYAESNKKEILIRAPQEELAGLVEQVTKSAPRDEAVALQVGPVAVAGRTGVQDLLQRQSGATGDADGHRARYGEAASGAAPEVTESRKLRRGTGEAGLEGEAASDRESSGAAFGPFDLILRAVGLTPEVIASIRPPETNAESGQAAITQPPTNAVVSRDAPQGSSAEGASAPANEPPVSVGSRGDRPDDKTKLMAAAKEGFERESPPREGTEEAASGSGSTTSQDDAENPLREHPSLVDERIKRLRSTRPEDRRVEARGPRAADKSSDSTTDADVKSVVELRSRMQKANSVTMVIEIIVQEPSKPGSPGAPPRANRPEKPAKPDPVRKNGEMK